MEQINQIPLSSVILSKGLHTSDSPINRVTHKIITASQNYCKSSSWIQMTTEYGKSSQLLEAEVIRLSINNSFRGHMGIHLTSFPITRSGIIGFLCRKSRLYFHVSCLGYQWLPIHIRFCTFSLFFGYTSVSTQIPVQRCGWYEFRLPNSLQKMGMYKETTNAPNSKPSQIPRIKLTMH